MVLGTYTFVQLPRAMTLVKADRICSWELTYSSVAFFSWAPTIVGKVIDLEWNAMIATQFASLDAIYQADAQVVWDPTDVLGGSATYNVQVVACNGEYIPGMIDYRGNCTLTLLIMSTV